MTDEDEEVTLSGCFLPWLNAGEEENNKAEIGFWESGWEAAGERWIQGGLGMRERYGGESGDGEQRRAAAWWSGCEQRRCQCRWSNCKCNCR